MGPTPNFSEESYPEPVSSGFDDLYAQVAQEIAEEETAQKEITTAPTPIQAKIRLQPDNDQPSKDHWSDAANCKGKLSLFFGPAAERLPDRRRREMQAKAVCDSCVVQLPCLIEGRTNREHGVWGKETEEERRKAGFGIRALRVATPRWRQSKDA